VDKVESLCAEFGIEIVPRNVYPKPGQTRALATIRRIIARHGEGHARLVLSTLAETAANQGLIDQVSLWACSGLVLACSDWVENHAEEWFEAWDEVRSAGSCGGARICRPRSSSGTPSSA
jgi:hypothetical protein